MELLVVRHAIAEDRETFAKTGKHDSERPLTAEGRRKFEKGARGLASVAPRVALVGASDLVRAIETAEILRAALGGKVRIARIPELAPDAEPDALLRWVRRQRGENAIAVVGHEPHLSRFVAHALAGHASPTVELKKGGACLLDLGGAARAGSATLRWLLTAAQLRRLAP